MTGPSRAPQVKAGTAAAQGIRSHAGGGRRNRQGAPPRLLDRAGPGPTAGPGEAAVWRERGGGGIEIDRERKGE